MRLCTCGARASVRFSRKTVQGRTVREDRCQSCADDVLRQMNTGSSVVWQVATITDDLLAEHAREDARDRRGDTDTDMMLMAFGSDY